MSLEVSIYGLVAMIGFATGLVFKVPLLILLSALAAGSIGAASYAASWPVVSALGTIALALLTLQVGYLAGLLCSTTNCQAPLD
jgi:hypothetical protein